MKIWSMLIIVDFEHEVRLFSDEAAALQAQREFIWENWSRSDAEEFGPTSKSELTDEICGEWLEYHQESFQCHIEKHEVHS